MKIYFILKPTENQQTKQNKNTKYSLRRCMLQFLLLFAYS